jgi:hypothetical protein
MIEGDEMSKESEIRNAIGWMRDEVHEGCDAWMSSKEMLKNTVGMIEDEGYKLSTRDKQLILDALLAILRRDLRSCINDEW